MRHYTDIKENQWLLVASTDGNMVDYEEIIISDEEPDFWMCYEIAEKHGCEFFHVEQLEVA